MKFFAEVIAVTDKRRLCLLWLMWTLMSATFAVAMVDQRTTKEQRKSELTSSITAIDAHKLVSSCNYLSYRPTP